MPMEEKEEDNAILIIQCESHVTMAWYPLNAVYEEWIPEKKRSCAPCLIRSHGQPTRRI